MSQVEVTPTDGVEFREAGLVSKRPVALIPAELAEIERLLTVLSSVRPATEAWCSRFPLLQGEEAGLLVKSAVAPWHTPWYENPRWTTLREQGRVPRPDEETLLVVRRILDRSEGSSAELCCMVRGVLEGRY